MRLRGELEAPCHQPEHHQPDRSAWQPHRQPGPLLCAFAPVTAFLTASLSAPGFLFS